MFHIPQYVLEKLRCSICGSYLSSKPLMVRVEDQQVCGKCYKLLPTEEKEKCVRQIGLESIAEIIQFPCRYNTQGCSHTFNWCDEKEHEATCPYRSLISFSSERARYFNLDSINTCLHNDNEIICESDQIKAILLYDIKENTYTNEAKCLKYSLNIKGNCDRTITIKNNNTNEATGDVEIRMNGNIFLGKRPEVVYSDIKVKPIEHNIYETLTDYDLRDKKCTNCGNHNVKNHCLLGHSSCNKCQGNVCVECVKLLEKDSKTLCKNYPKGCRETLQFDNAHRHEVNCQYNDFKCILDPCNVITTLPNFKEHIKNDHSSEIFLTNEINKKFVNKDETIVIFYYGSIFKCVYFYYKTFVEFYVTFVGSSDEAVNYFYEITIKLNGSLITKRSKCSNWNDVMLEKGITFDRVELLGDHEKKLNIQVNLKILNKK